MRPFQRKPSAEFEQISLDDLSTRPENAPQIQVVPPPEQNPQIPASLSPSRPIILSRVSLRRTNTSNTHHWRKPSYSRVDSAANPRIDPPEPTAPRYDEEGGVDPELHEVAEGLNAALGTSTDLGSWLPTTRQPSIRRVEQLPAPQIVVEDTSVEEVLFEPDERDTAGLTDNASQIAGAPSLQRARTLGTLRPRIDTSGILGSDLGTVERRGSAVDIRTPSIDQISNDGDRNLSPRGNSVIRHLRKASQRVVNIANTDDQTENAGGFSFPGASPKLKPTTPEDVEEIPFPSLGAPISPIHKISTEFAAADTGHSPWIETVELRGKSLGIFSADNAFRNWLCDILLHPATEFIILLVIIMQTIFLIIQSAPNVDVFPQTLNWGHSWVDYCLLAVFIFYTIELIVRMIVSGFIFNPPTALGPNRKSIGPRPIAAVVQNPLHSSRSKSRSKSPGRKDTLKRQYSTSAVRRMDPSRPRPSASSTADLRRQYSTLRTTSPGASPERGQQQVHLSSTDLVDPSRDYVNEPPDYPVPIFSAATFHKGQEAAQAFRDRHKSRLARRAYLRHSFNRIDFIAVVSYWIALVLELTGVMTKHHIYIFRMLSCLRIFRLLGITEGTSTILRSLKKAAPLLVQVAFFVGFFWIIFAIIGIQTFRGSFRRQCVWVDPLHVQANFTQQFQFCGGYLDPVDFSPQPYITANGLPSNESPKGFLCPVQSFCVEGSNPYNGTVSFDNIIQSLELVFVIISANTFTDLMYYAIDAEFLVAALFFVIGIVVLSFWIVNLVIAVITSSFHVTREELQQSAFVSRRQQKLLETEHEATLEQRPISSGQRLYSRTKIIWIALIAVDLTIQALRTSTMSTVSQRLLSVTETVATVIFDVEIIIRLVISFPDWRAFFRKKANCFDLFLATATVYGWLTIFQIMRVYRVIMAVPVTRDLLSKVLSNVYGILNLIMFLFMITFFVAILACQLVRGDIPSVDLNGNQHEISFRTIWNSFLGMYQILSSENWTQILYAATSFQTQYHIAWVSATFMIAWFMVGNNVVLTMFIAVIQENIGVSEEEKRKEQVRAFIEKAVPTLAKTEIRSNLTLASVFRKKKTEPLLDSGPQAFNLLMKEAVMREFLDEQENNRSPPQTLQQKHQQKLEEQKSVIGKFKRWLTGTKVHRTLGETLTFYSNQRFSVTDLSLHPNTMAQDAMAAHAEQRAHQADYLKSNPEINKSLWIFTVDDPIRRICQLLVMSGRGERLEGIEPNPVAWWCFSVSIYAAIVCIVVLACITTPIYQIQYFAAHGDIKFSWITWSDITFALIFSVEAVIKIIADGFLLTPDAYIRNVWNGIDFFVLLTLWINVAADLTDRGGLSRSFRAFKALRALRLVNISETARQTFQDVIISGFWNILAAAIVAMSLLVPYAIWGLNIFNGLFFLCNDGSNGINETSCIGEYGSTPQAWTIWTPRSWANPQFYHFDDFGSSLAILFEIVSQEGWINVMTSAMAIVGLGENPRMDASPGNAFFFVTFNILGAVFVLTLFVSVIITNYTKRSGLAYMTAEQRSWQELRNVLLQLSPSRRPPEKPDQSWRAWCYYRAISKHGYWTRCMTGFYVLHIILLMVEIYPSSDAYNLAQNYAFLVLSIIYVINIIVRMVGLGTYHYFRSKWDVYDIIIVTGTLGTTLTLIANVHNNTFLQFQKLFLVAIAFNLIPKSDALDQLFKTAASSLPTIASLLCIWLVLFVVYAIAFTQIFGLTRLGPNSTGTLNFRTIPNALIVLFRMSLGEGWNQIMADYTITSPHCISDPNFFKDDCGSPSWAYGLFISWNILSMYIFANMLLTVVYENFSFVYQRAGKLKLFSREEIRRFKKVWAKFDQRSTGYIKKEDLPRFFSQLRGLFEVRIYDEDRSVPRILEQCKRDPDPSNEHIRGPTDIDHIDLRLLQNSIDQLPVEEIRERRRNYNILYEEAMISADARGISFTAMLLMLAHYKFIDDNKALSLDEFLRRRAKLVRVTDHVNEKICRGFFQTLYWRRAFLARRSANSSFTVPSIVVQESDTSALSMPRPTLPPLDMTQLRSNTGAGYSPVFEGQDRLQPSYSPQSEVEDEASSPVRTWSTIGGPDSQVALAEENSELSQEMDENEANQVVRSLNQSAWRGAIHSTSRPTSRGGGSDRSGGSDRE